MSADDLPLLLETVKKFDGVTDAYLQDEAVHVVCRQHTSSKDLNRFCFTNGIVLNQLTIKHKSLESTFLEITGKVSER